MADRQSTFYSYPPIPCPQSQFIQPYASHVTPPPVNGGLQMAYLNPAPPVNGGLQMAYLNPAHGSQTWVPEQAVASHSIPNVSNVIQPLVENPLPVASSNPPQTTNWSNAHLRSNAPKRKPKLSQSVRCEICDIYCNSLELYEKHLSGKKHLKTLKKNYPPLTTPSQPTPQSVVNSSTPEKLLTTCNVPCDNDRGMENHLAGHEHGAQEISITTVSGDGMDAASSRSDDEGLDAKKRKLMESGVVEESVLLSSTGNAACGSNVTSTDHLAEEKHNLQGATTSTEIPSVSPGEDLGTKKQKLIQCGVAEASVHVCTVCNVVCNSEVVFADHVLGKKHIAQKSSGGCNVNQLIPPTAQNPPENSNSKKQKVTRASSTRVCALCDVVCNSDSVFNSHLAGHKHAFMLKKMAQAAVPPPPPAPMPQ